MSFVTAERIDWLTRVAGLTHAHGRITCTFPLATLDGQDRVVLITTAAVTGMLDKAVLAVTVVFGISERVVLAAVAVVAFATSPFDLLCGRDDEALAVGDGIGHDGVVGVVDVPVRSAIRGTSGHDPDREEEKGEESDEVEPHRKQTDRLVGRDEGEVIGASWWRDGIYPTC
jgi:hypothetical protein